MTQKEFLTKVAKLEKVDLEIINKAEELLNALNAKEKKANEKRNNDPERLALMNGILEFLGSQSEPVLAKEIAEHLGVNTQKILPILKKLIEAVVIDTAEQKTKSAPLLYFLIPVEGTDIEEE